MLPPSQSIFSEELQKMEETNNSESSNSPQVLRALPKSLSCTLPQTRKASFCYNYFSGLPDCVHPRARTRFSGDYQLNPEYGTAAVPASGGFLLHKYENQWKLHSSDATEFWNPLEEKVFLPPPFFPDGCLGSHSAFTTCRTTQCLVLLSANL